MENPRGLGPARPPAGSARSCCPSPATGPARHRRPRRRPPDAAASPTMQGPHARQRGAGALRRPVLVAPGILPDGRKGIIGLQPARGESAAERDARSPPSTGAAPPAKAPKRSVQTAATASPAPSRPSIRTSPSGATGPTESGTSPTNSGSPTGRTPNATSTTPEHHRRTLPRRPLAGCLSEGRQMPARRPPRPLPIPHTRRAQAGAGRKRRRTALPGGPAKDPAHGHLPGPHPHGTRPLRNPPVPEQKRPDRRPFCRDA